MFLAFPDLYAKKEKMLYSGYLVLELWVRNSYSSREQGQTEYHGGTGSVWTSYTLRCEGDTDGT